MKRIRWKWFLPIMQLIFASAALVYGPPEYRARLRLDGVLGDNNVLEYFNQNTPAPVERASYGINFPALVLDYPLMKYTKDLFYYSNDYTYIHITPRGVGFFVGIAIFWYWGGEEAGSILRAKPNNYSSPQDDNCWTNMRPRIRDTDRSFRHRNTHPRLELSS